MTTTAATENAVGSGEKAKEKVEKRRALGRGLESLLPGPRVVVGAAAPAVPTSTHSPVTDEPLPISSRPHESAVAATPPPEEGVTIHAEAESRIPGNLVVNLEISDIDRNPFQTRYVERAMHSKN